MHRKLQHLMIQYDAIRLIAILAIVLLHTAANGVTQLPPGSSDWWLANFADSAGRVGVPLFLMLTGATLLNRPTESVSHFYRRRLQRLAFPVLAWSLIYLFWAQLKAVWKQQPLDLSTKLSGIVTGNNYFHLWFIYVVIALYVCLPALRFIWLRLNRREQITLTVIALCLQQVGLLLRFCRSGCTQTSAHWPTLPDFLVNAEQLPWPFWFIAYVPYVILGALLSQPRQQAPLTRQIQLLILVCGIIATAALYALQRLHFDAEPFYYAYHRLSSPVLCSAVMIWLLTIHHQTNAEKLAINSSHNGFSAILVRYSFGIYLSHPIWLDLTNMLTQQTVLNALPYAMKLPLQTLLILLGSVFFCLCWQKYLNHRAR